MKKKKMIVIKNRMGIKIGIFFSLFFFLFDLHFIINVGNSLFFYCNISNHSKVEGAIPSTNNPNMGG